MTCLCSLLVLALSFQLLTLSSTPTSIVVDLERYGEVGLLLLFLATLSHVERRRAICKLFSLALIEIGFVW
jgi:hypothetical protein